MIPRHDKSGNLPAGIHEADWRELETAFGGSARRVALLAGLREALTSLRRAGCSTAYVDGSFVTANQAPADFDACRDPKGVVLDALDTVLLDFSEDRRAQKQRYGGKLFPADVAAEPKGTLFIDFFQLDRHTGARKGDRQDRSGGSSVIANERQYRISKAELRRFEEGYAPSAEVDPRMKEVMADALESQLETLRSEVRRYEDLREGRVAHREIDGLRDLPVALIEARIAAGLTQKSLAGRLGLSEQQIQRWEATLYSGVGVERLQEIADALGMGVREVVSYAVPG